MNFSFFLTAFVLLHHVVKLVYLFAEPKVLNPKYFGPPKSKFMIGLYYLAAMFLMLTYILEKLGIPVFVK